MTLNESLVRMDRIYQEIRDIRERKGHDYAGTEDSLRNLRDFGWQGVIVRLGDKYHRLRSFVQQDELKVTDETIRDTMIDLCCYSFLCLLMYDEEQHDR